MLPTDWLGIAIALGAFVEIYMSIILCGHARRLKKLEEARYYSYHSSVGNPLKKRASAVEKDSEYSRR